MVDTQSSYDKAQALDLVAEQTTHRLWFLQSNVLGHDEMCKYPPSVLDFVVLEQHRQPVSPRRL